jgi:hypothetical protein
MNGAQLNMVLLLGTAVMALVGKVIYERVMTRIEDRHAREATASVKRGSELPHRP